MQLYLRPFYNFLRQPNRFEWTLEHQKRFDEIKTFLTEKISNTIPNPDQAFYTKCDASNFAIGAARFFNQIKVQMKRTLYQQVQDFLYMKNLDSLLL